MLWEDFLRRMTIRTGCPRELIRVIVEGIPEVLMEMEPGERTRTPLGYFTMHNKKARMVNYFGNKKYFPSKAAHVVKLKPGLRLQREPPPSEDENTIEFNADFDPQDLE